MSVNKIIITGLLFLFSNAQSFAEAMTQGEMAGIIRSAGHPCNRVLNLNSTGENSWEVQCNSGKFFVSRNKDGGYAVAMQDES